jgi:hypothetical protein
MIRKVSGITVLAVTAALNLAQPRNAFAWGDEGHEVVAFVAQSFLEPDVRKRVSALLAADTDSLPRTTSLRRPPGRTSSGTPISMGRGTKRGSGTSSTSRSARRTLMRPVSITRPFRLAARHPQVRRTTVSSTRFRNLLRSSPTPTPILKRAGRGAQVPPAFRQRSASAAAQLRR